MNDETFKGKTAVITGAASGMGLLTSQLLAKGGARVVLCDISADAVVQAAESIRKEGGEALAVVTDVRKYADAEKAANAAVKTFGTIDLLLCFAGGYEPRLYGG